MSSQKFPRCSECGGTVKLIAKPGRTRQIYNQTWCEIPEYFELPECIKCKERYITEELSDKLDKILEKCTLTIGHLAFNYVSDYGRIIYINESNQIYLACSSYECKLPWEAWYYLQDFGRLGKTPIEALNNLAESLREIKESCYKIIEVLEKNIND